MKNQKNLTLVMAISSMALLVGCSVSSSSTPKNSSSNSQNGGSNSSSSDPSNTIYDTAKDLVGAFDDALFNHKTSFSLSYHSSKFEFDPTKILEYSSYYDDCVTADKFTKTNGDPTILHFNISYSDPGTTADSEPSSYVEALNVATTLMKEARGEVGGALPIEQRTKTFNVSDSEQLYYAVSQGYKPICTGGAATIYEKAKTVYSSIVGTNFTDYDKVTAIYDWIGNNVSYDEDGVKKKVENPDYKNADNSYLEGVFNRGLAVCDGYSKAFALLCGMGGLDCYRVVGSKPSAAGDGTSVGHAWNFVKVDGNWYASDPTANNIKYSTNAGGLDSRFELGNHDLMLTRKENLETAGYVQRSLVYPKTPYFSSYYYNRASLSKEKSLTLTIENQPSFKVLFDLFDAAESTSIKYLEFFDESGNAATFFNDAKAGKSDASLYEIDTQRHAMYYCPAK